MTRGTTPVFLITLNGAELSSISEMFVTFRQDALKITKTIDDIEIVDSVIRVPLTQEESLMFHRGKMSLQIRGIIDDTAFATNILEIPVKPILLEGVIPECVTISNT